MRLKRFLLASALALSFTVSAPAVAKADPITAAVVAWTGFTGAAAAVATFVVNTALYAAGSWAVTKAAKALGLMKSSVAERQASVTTLSLGETPREAVVGVACVGGSLIDAWNHGGKYGTDYVTRRVALADHVLDGLIGYYVDDTYYPFNANGVQPGFKDALQLTFVNATRDGAFPPPYMLQAGVGLTSADRCPSVAEIWITYKFDDQVWTRGHPGLKFVVRGLRTYDPRFDPQYGYSGPAPQTWGDVSTHRFSENAAVVRYNIQRGIYAVGRHGELEHLLIGRGLSADEAPAGRIIAAANVCDEIVDGLPRYTVGGAISSAQAHIEVEEMFAAATAGQIVQRDGGVGVEPGQAKAPVVTITDGDLVAGEAISFDEFTPDTDGGRINTVIARYVEPSQLYKDHSGAVLREQADIIEDGGPRELTLSLMLVTNKGQADRCAEITRRGARLERRARIALVPILLAGRASAELEDGDIIAWQSNRYHEGATVRYRIEAYGVDEGWRNTLQLREMASSVFGQPDPIEDRAAPPPAPTPIDALQLIGVQAEAITLAGETSALPAVRFSWDVNVEDTAITAIRAEVRKVGETEIAPTRIDDVAKGQAVVTAGVWPDTQLECRLVPIGDPTRPVLLSNWIRVSTVAVKAGVSDQVIEQIKADLEAILKDSDASEALAETVLREMVNRVTALKSETRARIADVLAERAARGEDIAEVRTETGIIRDGLAAEVVTRTEQIAATEVAVALAEERTRTYADGKYALVEQTFTTTAAFQAGLSITLAASRSYTDALKAEASQTYATLAALGSAQAFTLSEAKSYADTLSAAASLTYATKAEMGANYAATLTQAQSYADSKVASALNTVYTKAETDAGNASILQSAKAYSDAFKSEALQTFSTKAELGGVSGQAALALSTAVTAENKVKAKIGLVVRSDGLIGGIEAENDGTTLAINFLSSIFNLYSTGSGIQSSYIEGRWYLLDPDAGVRALYGLPFGGADKLVWWIGPNTVPIFGETKGNAYVFMSMVAPRFGGNDIQNGGALKAVADTGFIGGGRSGAGPVQTSNTVTVTVSGGTAGATIRWVRLSGDSRINMNNPTGFSTGAYATIGVGEVISAYFMGAVVRAGESAPPVYVQVDLSDNGT